MIPISSSDLLKLLVGKAVANSEFREGVLDGHRAELISGLGLCSEQVSRVVAVRANTFEEFVRAIERIVAESA